MNLRGADYFGGDSVVTARTRRRMATAPASGTNNVFVAHGNVIRAATGEYPGEAGAILFRPHGKGFSVHARVSPQDWAQLAARFAKSRRDE